MIKEMKLSLKPLLTNMKKIILKIFLAALFFLTTSQSIMAADLNYSCTASDCTPTTSGALFPSSEIWYPGKTLSKTVNFSNISGDPIEIIISNENTSTTGDLDKVINLTITRSLTGIVLFDDTVSNFYGSSISLPTLTDSINEDYVFEAIMDPESGNEFQNKSTKFDLLFNFTVGFPPAPLVAGGGGTVAGASTGASAPVCNDQKPGSAPVLQSAVAGVNSVILNWSEANSPVTYYLVTYGVSPSNNTYGNPNVGGSGTTSYTVSGLSGGTTYCFLVRAGNGCMPGDFSNQICATPGGVFIAGPAAGFQPGVLGEATESAKLKEATKSGSVKGISANEQCPYCIWWQILLGELIVLIIYYYILVKDKLTRKTYFIGFLIPVITYIVFYLLNRSCAKSFWVITSNYFFCKYFIAFDLTLYGLISILKRNKNNSNSTLNSAS